MTVDDVRAHLRPLLERDYCVDGASYLLDRPPGGWSDLATKGDLDALRQELRAEMAELRGDFRTELRTELQAQTKWLAMFVIAAQGVVVATIGVIGALLRFA